MSPMLWITLAAACAAPPDAAWRAGVATVEITPRGSMWALGGEVVVDYALRLKKELAGPAVWIAGYSNDVFGYVPSLCVLTEGDYEGGEAMRFTSLPGPFAPSVEERIVKQVHELAQRVDPAAAQLPAAPATPGVNAMLDALAPILAQRIAARDTQHVVFHGCIDWHSAVHGHWALLRVARTTGRHQTAAQQVAQSLRVAGLAEEALLLRRNASFEMPYGRAWFLLLAEEFERWATETKQADPHRLRPLANEVAASLEQHFGGRAPRANVGEYRNPTWALLRLHGWFKFMQDAEGRDRIEELVARIDATDLTTDGLAIDLKRNEFFSRLGNYLTLLAATQPAALADWLRKHPLDDAQLLPLRELPRSAHALGLNWSRAWAFKTLAVVAPEADRARYRAAYEAHVAQAWKHHAQKVGDIWAYDHWVPQFAVYALTDP